MLAMLFLFTSLTFSKLAVALNIPYGYESTGPLNYSPSENPFSMHPDILQNDNNLGQFNLQAQQLSPDNCPNLEILQNILNVLKTLLSQDNSQYLQPKRKLQILAYLKKELQRSGSLNNDIISKLDSIKDPVQSEVDTNKASIINRTGSDALYQNVNNNPNSQIEAHFSLKYTLPGSVNCKEVLIALLQAVNTAHSQLLNYCNKSGKCNVGEAANDSNVEPMDLPSILSHIIISSHPQYPLPQAPANPSHHGQSSDNFLINPSTQNELYNYYLSRLLQNYNVDFSNNKQGSIDNGFQNILDDKAKTTLWQNSLDSHNNMSASNLDSSAKLSYDDLLKLVQETGSSATLNQFNTLTNDFQIPTSNLNNAPGNIHPNPNSVGNFESNPLIYTIMPENYNINNPSLGIQESNVLGSATNRQDISNFNFNSNQDKAENQVLFNPIVRPNPYGQHITGYLNHDIYGNKFASQRLDAMSNSVKLNTAPGNNAIVELTYKLKQPQSLLNEPYYYVKYRMPYQTFVSKVLKLMRNPQLRSNPAKLYDELLSASILSESSSELKDVSTTDLSKRIVNNEGMLVSAKVMNTQNSLLDDPYIKTIQNLNAKKLITNDIVSMITNENKINRGPTDYVPVIKDANLNNNANNLLLQNIEKNGINHLVLPAQSNYALTMRSARKNIISPLHFYTKVPSHGTNPRVIYNTLLNTNSFSPFPFRQIPSSNPVFG